jgi:effector-binding domain-containing protein
MNELVHTEYWPALPVAVVRRRARPHELSKVVPEACGIVWNALRSHQISGAGRHIAIYFDDQINLEVGVELSSPFVGVGEVAASATPAGSVATATHLGPYGHLYRTHDAIRAWCAAQNYPLAGPSWEVYGHWKNDWNHAPEKIQTDVYYLLAVKPST